MYQFLLLLSKHGTEHSFYKLKISDQSMANGSDAAEEHAFFFFSSESAKVGFETNDCHNPLHSSFFEEKKKV